MIDFRLGCQSQSPDNSPRDVFKWGFLKDKEYSRKPPINKLKTANAQEVACMPAPQIGRVITHLKDCRRQQRSSAHTEHLL